MTALQNYIFRQILAPLGAILAALTVIAVLTQGLAQMELIVDQHSSALTYLWVTMLVIPQLLSLILPLALFFAVAYAVNRLYTDSELVVAYAAGVGAWQITAPIFRLSIIAGVVQLAVALLLQPASYREMREVVHALRGDLASMLVRDGAFTSPAKGLTVYAGGTGAGGRIQNLLIHDERGGGAPVTYTAREGSAAIVQGQPALILREGQIQQPKANGVVELLDFDQYVLEFGDDISTQDAFILKPSDRFLSDLLAPNLANFYDQKMVDKFLAEAHSRIASALLNPALAMIAVAGLLIGDFNRRGYSARLAQAAALALGVRLLALGVQAAARENPQLNLVQYILPLAVIVICATAIMLDRRRPTRATPPPDRPAHAPAARTESAPA